MIRILVIDDQLSDLELICRCLSSAGYQVSSLSESRAAVNEIRKVKPDAIVVDIMMPELSGFELARILQRDPELKEIPLIACTSRNSDLDRIWALKQGITQYVTKPFTSDQMVRAVQASGVA